MHGERSRIVQAKARVDVISEMTVKGVQVLFQIHVKEGQSPPVVVQRHAYPDRVHRDPQVRAPAVVQKLIFMPVKTEKHLKSTMSGDGREVLNIKPGSSHPVWDHFPTVSCCKADAES